MPEVPSWGWKDDHPIVNVNWDDAQAYCAWAGVKLPTEQQWEKAARGTEGRKYPWGNEWDATKCANATNHYTSHTEGTAPVGSYPQGASPYGVLDMAGNVCQWCEDNYDTTTDRRVIRGGSWSWRNTDYFRASNRLNLLPKGTGIDYGFRCAAGL